MFISKNQVLTALKKQSRAACNSHQDHETVHKQSNKAFVVLLTQLTNIKDNQNIETTTSKTKSTQLTNSTNQQQEQSKYWTHITAKRKNHEK